MIDAFNNHCIYHQNTYLVLAGSPGDGQKELINYILSSPNSSRIKYLGQISRSVKFSLMSLCTAYVQPSFYEGFGCAVAEAMSVGSPIIASSSGGLEYLCSDASLRVDPYIIETVSSALNLISDSPAIRLDLASNAFARAHSLFSFDSKVKSFSKLFAHPT